MIEGYLRNLVGVVVFFYVFFVYLTFTSTGSSKHFRMLNYFVKKTVDQNDQEEISKEIVNRNKLHNNFPSPPTNNVYTLAYEQSNGYFNNIHEMDWKMLQNRVMNTPDCLNTRENEKSYKWFQNNFDPKFTCLHESRLGGLGDGPKWVCE